MNELITVVTPTFNREEKLINLFNSLCKQTSLNFCWLVIDDGSTDATEKVINSFQIKSSFSIFYFKKENGGKHTALNLAIDTVQSELFFIVDSDDVLVPDAIESIVKDWGKYKDHELVGISYLRGYSQDKIIGNPFPKNYEINRFAEIRINQQVVGDKAEVWCTKYLKKFRFPVFKDEKFISENFIWLQMSKEADMLFINQIIYITEYLEGGLTKSGRKLRINCPNGGMAYSLMAMGNDFIFSQRFKNAILYSTYFFFSRNKLKHIYNISYPALLIFTLPLGFLLYLYWGIRYKR